MKKPRAFALILAVMLFLAVPFSARAAEEPAEKTVTYEELAGYIKTGNNAYKQAESEFSAAQSTYNDLQNRLRTGWNTMDLTTMFNLQTQRDTAYETMQTKEEALAGTLKSETLSARTAYINQPLLARKLADSRAELSALETQLAANKRKLELGLISRAAYQTAEKQAEAQRAVVTANEKSLNENLSGLRRTLGLSDTAALTLGDLPEMNLDAIPGRTYDADLEAYLAHSSSLAQKKKTMDKATGSAYTTAKLQYDQALADAKAAFASSYESLLDNYKDFLDDEADLADKEESLSKTDALCRKGLVSKKQLDAKRDERDKAESTVYSARLNLFIQWEKYLAALQ